MLHSGKGKLDSKPLLDDDCGGESMGCTAGSTSAAAAAAGPGVPAAAEGWRWRRDCTDCNDCDIGPERCDDADDSGAALAASVAAE